MPCRAVPALLDSRLVGLKANTDALLLAAIINHAANDTCTCLSAHRLPIDWRNANAQYFTVLYTLPTSSATPCFLG